MSIKQILQFPNPLLLTKVTESVTKFDEELMELSTDLRETAKMFAAEGLAATQVGVMRRVFVIKDQTTGDYITCVNPHITSDTREEIDSVEGCLSFPGVNEKISRMASITVTYQDEGGVATERTLHDVNAVAFQHELDHLNGVLFTQYMGTTQKRLALKRLAKVARVTKRNAAHFANIMNKELSRIDVAQEPKPATV